MLDFETFLTTLYVKVDDFCKSWRPLAPKTGRRPSLSASEVVTLAIVGQWRRFDSERDYYRWATRHLRGAFPNLPTRSQFNRLERAHSQTIVYFFLSLVSQIQPSGCAYEALDSTAVPTRNVKRRGSGHLAGLSDYGYSNRLGSYHGLHLLVSVTPEGLITGYGFGPGSTKDQNLAETFLALRAGDASLLPSVGQAKSDIYVVDKGFEGRSRHQHWHEDYAARVVCAPKRSRNPLAEPVWPKALRRWAASLRQIIETVNDKLVHTFQLERERPHDLGGFMARLGAKMALHNFCFWLNRQAGQAGLAFAELLDW